MLVRVACSRNIPVQVTRTVAAPQVSRGIGLLLTLVPRAKRFCRFLTQSLYVLSMGLTGNWVTREPCAAVSEVLAPRFGDILVGNTGTRALCSGKPRLVVCQKGTHTTVGIRYTARFRSGKFSVFQTQHQTQQTLSESISNMKLMTGPLWLV